MTVTLANLSGRTPAPEQDRPAARLSRPVIEVEIRRHLDAIRAGAAYRDSDHAAETMVKEPGLRVVLIALKAGGRLPKHRARASITVQAVEGTVRLTVEGSTIELTEGSLVAVAAGVPHDLETVAPGAVLVTMGGTQ